MRGLVDRHPRPRAPRDAGRELRSLWYTNCGCMALLKLACTVSSKIDPQNIFSSHRTSFVKLYNYAIL